MNRNMSRGRRQGNRGISNRGMDPGSTRSLGAFNDRSTASSGPLATDHIQLHDLDLELALLKRKRQLIEEQQQMLSSDPFGRPSEYDYGQPQSYDARQSISTQSFSHYYDTPGPQFDRFDRKRQAGDNSWQNSSTPKRFAVPQRGPSNHSGARPGQYPKPSDVGAYRAQPPRAQPPRFQPQSHQRSNAGPAKPHMDASWPKSKSTPRSRNFNPTKVTKPKPNSAPNKLDSYPVAERRNLVSQASGMVKKYPSEQDIVLHADKPASRQMLGRMELALGNIFKDIKQLHGDNAPVLGTPALRIIKQAIRDRVRSVMLGKPVTNSTEILKIYREKYSKETDKEILNLGLQAAQSRTIPIRRLAIRLTEKGDPEKFFRTNFNKLLSRQLDEMFNNLYNLYKEDKDNGKSVQDIVNTILEEEGSILESVFNLKDSTDTKIAEQSQTAIVESSTEDKQTDSQAEVIDDNATEVEADKSQAEENTESETPVIDESTTENKPTDESGDNLQIDDKVAETAAPKDNDDGEKMTTTETNGENDDEDLSTIDPSLNDDSKTADAKKQAVGQFRVNVYTRLMEMLLKRRLPYILPKYKDVIMKKILNSDETYKTTLAHVIVGTNKRAQKCDEEATIQEKEAGEKSQVKPARTLLPYFVKIFGHPTLPKRKLMQAFLDQFHPVSIKKHRGVHNLLFVNLADKDDFDNILAANQTIIGNCKVDIKASEKVNKPEKTQQASKIGESETKDAEPILIEDDTEVKIDSELDDQINDLLTTIREEEERDEADQKAGEDADKGGKQGVEKTESQNEPEKLVQEKGGSDAKEDKTTPVADAKEAAKAAPVAATKKAAPVATAKEAARAAPVATAKETAKPTPAADAMEAAKVTPIADDAPATRVATPAKAPPVATTPASTIRTRRASRLEKQN